MLSLLRSRYQPDAALEWCPGSRERDLLASEESELTESESHLHMLSSGSSTMQTVLHPPASPSEHSSSVVNCFIGVLGRQTTLEVFICFPSMIWRVSRLFVVWLHVPVLVVCVVSYLTTYYISSILAMEVWILVLLSVCLLIFSACVLMVCRQPQTSKKVSFMVRGHWTNRLFTLMWISITDGGWSRTVSFVVVPGSSPAIPAYPEYICQCIPHGSAEWRHLDPFLSVDGSGWVVVRLKTSKILNFKSNALLKTLE